MALNIKNVEVERLASEIARLTGDSKTEAIRKALAEKRSRLSYRVGGNRAARLKEFLEREVWPGIPRKELGRTMTRKQKEALLGYGKSGA